MRPSALSVANYRSFPERTRLRLAPITMLYGWNNAGKSALLRAVALLASSVRDSARAPLDLSLFERRGFDIRTIFWGGDPSLVTEEGVLLGLEWDDGEQPSSAEYVIDYSREQLRSYVRTLRVWNTAGADPMVLDVDRGEQSLKMFRGLTPASTVPVEVPFVGLTPPEGVPELSNLRARLIALRDRVLWLRAVRGQPDLLITPDGEHRRNLSRDGSDAAQVLLADKGVRERVAQWYRDACGREMIVQDAFAGAHRILLPLSSAPGMGVHLLDTGEGMVQCLPVLVAGALAGSATRSSAGRWSTRAGPRCS